MIPDPYKTYMAAGFSRTGKKGNNAMYYLHVEPGNKRYGSIYLVISCGCQHTRGAVWLSEVAAC